MELISANGKTYIKDVDEASPAHAAKLRPGMLVRGGLAYGLCRVADAD